MPKESPDDSGSSITHWGIKADKTQANGFSKKLVEQASTKEEGLRFLNFLGLPRYKKISVSLQDFLADPSLSFAQLPSETGYYYSSIVDFQTGERLFGLEQTKKTVIKFIKQKLANKEIGLHSQLILSEYWHNYYGGNLVINERGEFFVELVRGKHAKLNKGMGQVCLRAEAKPFTKAVLFKNNEEIDQSTKDELSQVIINLVNLIPKKLVPLADNPLKRFQELVYNEQEEACVVQSYPGYFEFILTKQTSDANNWKVIFIDARTGEAAKKYQLSE